MRTRIPFLLVIYWLLSVLLMAGCSITSGKRNRSLAPLELNTLTNLVVNRTANNLQIRYALRGKDTYAYASWPAPTNNLAAYHHELAVLTLEKPSPTPRRVFARRVNRVAIRDARQWQQLVQEIWQGLVPGTPNHGVLLFIQNQEVVVYRDTQQHLGVVRFEHRPREVVLDQTYNDADFSRQAIELLETQLKSIDREQRQFFFITGQEPPFALIDLDQRLTVFFSYPAEPESVSPGAPAWFVLRTINSLLIKSVAITAIKNPFTLICRGLWHIGNCGATALQSGPPLTSGPPPPLAAGQAMDLEAWEKDLDRLVGEKRYKGTLELLIDGQRFFPALIAAIQNAERSIDVLVYIFDIDDYAVKIANLLKERSAGLRVRVLLDEMGSLFASQNTPRSLMPADFTPPSDIKSFLRAGAKVQVRTATNPWLTADHRKCILIDEQQAFIGGMNLGRQYRYEWHDLMVGLRGPIVGRLDTDFSKAWAHASLLGDLAYLWVSLFDRATHPKMRTTEGIDSRPLYTQTGKLEIYRAQIQAIQRARKYIFIENSYFVDRSILRELVLARQRGVDVRVILPGENDLGIMKTSNLVMANTMIQHGIRVYAYPGMTHVKAAIFDGWACLGSANFTKMSLRVCQEQNLAFSDPATVERLKQDLFETDFAKSRELTKPVPTNWLDSLVAAFADQM